MNQASQSTSPGWAAGTIIRFSRTVSVENSWAIWKVRSRPLWKSACGERPVISSPSSQTRPEVGGKRPAMTLNSVDLPAPFGPIRPVIEPLAMLDRGAVDGTDAAEVHVQVLDPDHARPRPMRPAPRRAGRLRAPQRYSSVAAALSLIS